MGAGLDNGQNAVDFVTFVLLADPHLGKLLKKVLSKDGCKKMRLVTIRASNAVAIGHSLNLKGSTDSSGKKH